MDTHFRKSFYHKGERLFSYPIDSEVDDAQIATLEILAHQRGCAPDEIVIYLEECAEKVFDFSRSCISEQIGERNGEKLWRILDVSCGRLYTHTGALDDFIAKYEAGTI